uniref:F-box domain-containing protein n=1 Tax=Strigamia maritima TaxID=126957 RepID=T1J1J7_STRMM
MKLGGKFVFLNQFFNVNYLAIKSMILTGSLAIVNKNIAVGHPKAVSAHPKNSITVISSNYDQLLENVKPKLNWTKKSRDLTSSTNCDEPTTISIEMEKKAHSHCETCIKIKKCSVRPKIDESCAIMTCTAECGARFHSCKLPEHKLLCMNEKVPCINSINGCPLSMPRHQLGRHLERCPASVVHCTMEWNRWPVCSLERLMHIPFRQPNPHVRPGQLDVALALRDQRMLNEWLRAPRRTRRVLRNNLTRRFPAVPFQTRGSYESESNSSRTVTDDEDDTPWEIRKTPPGLKRSVCGELYRASKQTTDSLSAALNIITNHVAMADEDKENMMDVYDHDLNGYDVLFVDNNVVSEISSASMADHARKQPSPPPPPPPSSPPMFVNLGLDLTLESITRYQTKPKSMYTFLCAQEFRRDEYSWHYKNVHGDIHGGLNGWLEQRCPLAHYGCMHSVRRFYPMSNGAGIVHNDILESFGVQPFVAPPLGKAQSAEMKFPRRSLSRGTIESIPEEDVVISAQISNSEPRVLTQMPFEVLQHVARFLDSFSLCNLAMTSRLLRDVCCSLLEERGIVVQQWERQLVGRKSCWRIAYQRWFFSTAFTPVVWWGFEEKENMSNHLQKCSYFQRNLKSDPYYYPMGAEPNTWLYEKLKASVALTQENQATKL